MRFGRLEADDIGTTDEQYSGEYSGGNADRPRSSGKGVALDEIRKTLEEYPEVSGAVISVGGSILTYGNKPEGGTWQIAVTDPLEPSQSAGVLTLAGGYCVSTSGDYERYVEVDGVRYHHILDPRTGSPARSDVAGVTIVTKDGFLSDALSTACFVLGSEEGQKLLENTMRKDCSSTMRGRLP